MGDTTGNGGEIVACQQCGRRIERRVVGALGERWCAPGQGGARPSYVCYVELPLGGYRSHGHEPVLLNAAASSGVGHG